MMRHTKRVLVLLLAVFFLILGVIGLVLPFLQGILFIIIGLMLLAIYSPRVKGWVDALASKHQRLEDIIKRIDALIERIIGKP